jgi:urease accessory protein
VVRAFAHAEAALVHLHNVSGGVLAGDRLALDVQVGAGAAAQITTTGATRLYRHRAGSAHSEQFATFQVEDGGELEYLPDPVIPYAGSRHCLSTEIYMRTGATLFWWDVLAPGRLAAGERFRFDRLDVHNEIRVLGRPVLREDYRLEPTRWDLSATARMQQYAYLATLYAVQEGRPAEFWRGLADDLNELTREFSRPGEGIWSTGTLVSHGILVRGLTVSGRFTHKPLLEFWRAAKRAITGREAVPPRKIY